MKFFDDEGTTYYASRKDGVKYEVSHDGKITGVSYIASSGDNYLRCSGFPTEDVSTARYKHFDEYSRVAVTDETARLDNFAVELQNNQNFRGYVIAYAGRRARADEARANANQVKGYLVKTRGVEPGTVITIDGGHREESTIELYVLPRDVPQPVPSHTIGTKEVQVIKARSNRGATRLRK
jgi:acyl CoA:acetate/3-ketoacid CoA transferase